MKKTLCFVMVLLTVAGLCACGAKEPEAPKTEQVDLTYFVSRGKMPEAEVVLGKDTAQLREQIEAAPVESSVAAFINEDEETGVTLLQSGNYAYYCKDGTELSAIVSFDKAFTFEYGAMAASVKAALAELKPTEGTVSAGCVLLPGMAGYQTVEYAFEKANVCFVFYESALCATVLYDPSVFTLE